MFRAKINSMYFHFLQLNTREIHKKSALHSLHRLLSIFTMSIQVNGNYVAREISCRKMCEGNWAIAKISSFKIRVGRAADRFIWIPWYIIIEHHAILCRLVFQPSDWSFSSPRVCRGSSPQLGQRCPWPLKSSSRGARTRRAKLKSAAMLLPIRSAKNGKQRYFYCTYKPFRNHFKNADKASLRGDFCKHVGLCLKADNLRISILVLISAKHHQTFSF